MCWGENIRSRPDLLPMASKTAKLVEEQFYCCFSSCTGSCTADNMSAEQWNQSRNDTADVAASETVVTVSKLWG